MNTITREIVATLALSWPIVLTNVAINFMTTTDVMFLGRVSPEALAAGTLGFNIYIPLFLFCVGVVSAAAPLAAERLGADPHDSAGVRAVAHQALITSVALALPLWAVFWNTGAILRAIGEPPELADMAETYMHGLQWALLPALLYLAARSALAALNHVGATLVAALLAVIANVFFNYVLVFGHFGIPALGLVGSGLATTLSQTLMFALLVGYAALDPQTARRRLFALPWRFERDAFLALWRLGGPIGFFIALEVAAFAGSALAMGLIGAAQVEAHAIALNVAATAFMVPLGLGQAATVRVGHAFGARDPAAISRAGWSAFAMAMVFVAGSALLMGLAPRLLISAFLDTDAPGAPAVVGYAVGFVRMAALFQFADGAQAALSNMLRGVQDSRVPLAMALIGYWGIGAPLGLTLAFFTPLEGLGLWIGIATGLMAVSIMLFARWRSKERAGFPALEEKTV
jgi:MATE family multidrug resistance protein